jgi:hypothetical protein
MDNTEGDPMKRTLILTCLWIALIAAGNPAWAVMDGYARNSIDMQTSIGGVFVVDTNETVYYGHSTSKLQSKDSSRSPSDEIWMYDTQTGTKTLFYSALDHSGPNQINSVSAMVIRYETIPWTYYIADQNTTGDPYSSGGIWRAQDSNVDFDINDPGETMLVTAENAMINITGLIRDDTSGDLFASNAAGITGSALVYRLSDVNFNGFFEPSEIRNYFLVPGPYFAGSLDFDRNDPNRIYAVDSSGSIYTLKDQNGDGDCLDLGDSSVYATLPLAGGYWLEVDPDGDIFVTASEYLVGHALFQIRPGSPPTVTEFDDLSGFAGWTGGFTFGTGAHFQANTPGAKLYMNYTNLIFGDPQDIVLYAGDVPDVPSTSVWGIVCLLIAMGGILLRSR